MKFDWLPTRGGIVRGLSYICSHHWPIFELSEFQQTETQHQHAENTQQLPEDERRRVELEQNSLLIFNSITEHYTFAQEDPVLIYDPSMLGLAPESLYRSYKKLASRNDSQATQGEIRPFLHSTDSQWQETACCRGVQGRIPANPLFV